MRHPVPNIEDQTENTVITEPWVSLLTSDFSTKIQFSSKLTLILNYIRCLDLVILSIFWNILRKILFRVSVPEHLSYITLWPIKQCHANHINLTIHLSKLTCWYFPVPYSPHRELTILLASSFGHSHFATLDKIDVFHHEGLLVLAHMAPPLIN